MEVNKILILALLFSFLTFLLGISLGYYLNKYLFDLVYEEYESVKLMVESMQYLTNDENYCDIEKFNFLTRSLDELGNKIAILQNSKSFFISENKFRLLKSQYFNLQYLHMSLARKMMERCNFNASIIIYFYDDSIECKECDIQGYKLSLLKAKYRDNLLIYSFDISYKNSFIIYFKEIYSIDIVPSIILITKNKTKVFRGLTDYEEIEKEL
ncbi:MAG: hypothetical protein QXQ91_05015 [Nanopusillaceae archaeon]